MRTQLCLYDNIFFLAMTYNYFRSGKLLEEMPKKLQFAVRKIVVWWRDTWHIVCLGNVVSWAFGNWNKVCWATREFATLLFIFVSRRCWITFFFHLKPRNTCGHWTTWNQLWANWNDDVGLVSQFLRHAPGKKYLHCETIQPCMSFSMGNHHINGTNYFPNTYEKRKSRLGNWIPAHREHPSILQKKMHTYFGIIPRRPWKHISLRLLPVKHSYVGCKPQSIQGIWYGALASALGCIA